MGSITTIILFGASVIFSSGGLFALLKATAKRVDSHEKRLMTLDKRMNDNEVSHQAILAGQEYIIKSLDENKDRMVRIEEKLDRS